MKKDEDHKTKLGGSTFSFSNSSYKKKKNNHNITRLEKKKKLTKTFII